MRKLYFGSQTRCITILNKNFNCIAFVLDEVLSLSRDFKCTALLYTCFMRSYAYCFYKEGGNSLGFRMCSQMLYLQ